MLGDKVSKNYLKTLFYCGVIVFLIIGRMYVLQRGMELDKSSPEAKRFLMALMDNLELVSRQRTL